MNNIDIMVMGDVHGEWGALNTLVNKKRPNIILQCGDFGYWPRMEEPDYRQRHIRAGRLPKHPKMPEGTTLYWCDGNHEDHESLGLRDTDEFWPRVIYKPRGSTLELPDGRVVLFMGGAASYDKEYRTIGLDWFPEEMISYAEVDALDPNLRVDIVISHTCPEEFDVKYCSFRMYDGCRKALSHILKMYRPSLWYFGHWHQHRQLYDRALGCRWEALSYAGGSGRWWCTLKS